MIALTLEGKVVIVTGAARGIGRAIALKMAEAGCMGLAINDVKMDDAGKSIAAEAKAFGAEVLLLEGDMSDEGDVKRVVGSTIEKWGRLDVMVNNAGIAIPDSMFDATADNWDRVIRVNMKSVFLGMKYAAEFMKDHGGGSIVNMGSIAGITGGNTSPEYGASKGGIIALSKFGAKTLCKYGIRVNAIAPGTIATEMIKRNFAGLDPESLQKRISSMPMGRMGTPEEVANAALYLACDLSSYTTGGTLLVTGGRTT